MAGLMGNAPPGQPPAELETSVSPEEQAQYDQFVTNAMSIMNDKKGMKKILDAIESGENPVVGLANVVTAIVVRVEDSAKQSGQEISGDVLLQGGAEILEQTADLAEQAGSHAFTEEELEQATYLSMDQYRKARGDKIDQKEQGASLQELQAAEADGSLEQQIPGLTEKAASMPKGGPKNGGAPQGQPQQKGLMG